MNHPRKPLWIGRIRKT